MEAVHSILRDGHIKPSDNGRVSTTRNPRYAKEWARLGDHHPATFVLNGNTIRHNHHVRPTDFDHGGGVYDKERHDNAFEPSSGHRSEAEESVKGSIHLKHVKELHIQRKDHHELTSKKKTQSEKEFHKEDPTHTHWMYQGMHFEDRMKQADDFHAVLKKHGIKLHLHD